MDRLEVEGLLPVPTLAVCVRAPGHAAAISGLRDLSRRQPVPAAVRVHVADDRRGREGIDDPHGLAAAVGAGADQAVDAVDALQLVRLIPADDPWLYLRVGALDRPGGERPSPVVGAGPRVHERRRRRRGRMGERPKHCLIEPDDGGDAPCERFRERDGRRGRSQRAPGMTEFSELGVEGPFGVVGGSHCLDQHPASGHPVDAKPLAS